ncbi:hypothetical protein SJ05684_b44830 (plasmid) [Sinorhizobium sojae CCBAU 05684]|uniref:Uncharacterized protein n=1 Tax=Sinorhizobium sojae CCBAU 05684 TaxID=716928 RepID=A0A249PIB5_9HYPH|nr:hypothetical protein [Sinorhizobium sojae]ASY65465.1 hypothetical protein SJ05684_b44830 [Sinorhizobium sojae CCBAU 05684]
MIGANFLAGLAAASVLQAAIDLLFWYGAHWYFLGANPLLAGHVLHPLDSFAASLFGLAAFTAAASLLPALSVVAFCRRRDIKGPMAYMTGGALTGVIGVLASVSNPFASHVLVYAAPLALSGIASGYVFWRVGIRAIEIDAFDQLSKEASDKAR